MDYRKLKYFVQVVDCGSFRSAAEALRVAQPALTRQIQALEAELGVSLLERSNTGVATTSYGKTLWHEARDILARTDALKSKVAPDDARARGQVRVGLPSALAELILGTLVERLRKSNPDVQIISHEASSKLIENTENGTLDVAVASLVSKRRLYRCQVDYLAREQELLVARKSDIPQISQISIDEAFTRQLILSPLPNARRQNFARLAQKRAVSLNVVAEAATMAAQLDLVLRGIGSAVLPNSSARLMGRSADLALVPIKGAFSYRALLTCTSSPNNQATALVGRLIKQIFYELI